MKVYIKNMVCQGTRKFVLMEIKKLGLNLVSFESGEIEFQKDLSPLETSELEYKLQKYGLEMLSGQEENDVNEVFEPAPSTVN